MKGEEFEARVQARVEEILRGFREIFPGEVRASLATIGDGASQGKELEGAAEERAVQERMVSASAPHRAPGRDPKRHPFEVYVASYTGMAQTSANVHVAWGTVLKSEADIAEVAEIEDFDETLEIAAGDWIWLECEFTADGELTSCALLSGGTWPDFPACYTENGEDGNMWYHPIAQVRQSRTGRSAGKDNAPFPDSGEFPDLKPSLVIAQLTHTHLVISRRCVAGTAMTRLWTLVPGQGGKQE